MLASTIVCTPERCALLGIKKVPCDNWSASIFTADMLSRHWVGYSSKAVRYILVVSYMLYGTSTLAFGPVTTSDDGVKVTLDTMATAPSTVTLTILVENQTKTGIFMHEDAPGISLLCTESNGDFSAVVSTLPPHPLPRKMIFIPPGMSRVLKTSIDIGVDCSLDRISITPLFGYAEEDFQIGNRNKLRKGGRQRLWGR